MSLFRDLLHKKLDSFYPISASEVDQLEAHFRLLQKWNRKLNLTGIRDVEEAVERHYCESIALGHALPTGSLRIIDSGTGAGFPGIPLAVVRPESTIYLVESDSRKAVFLKEATSGHRNCHVIRDRLERVDISVDWVVGRAVRWEEIVGAATRLAFHIGLMITSDQARSVVRDSKGVDWALPTFLPWDESRVLLLGKVVV